MTDVQGRCPACGGDSLFLGEGGHVTCSRLDCPDPSAADDMLGEGAPMLHRVAVLASDLFMAGAPGPERETARKFLEALQRSEPRLLDCGFCYEEQGEEVHPHPECPIGATEPAPSALRDQIAEALLDYLSRTADIRPGRNGELAFMPEVTDSERLRIADAVLAVLDPHGDTAFALELGHRCFLKNHEKRLARSEPPTIGTARIELNVSAPEGSTDLPDTVRTVLDREARRARRGVGDV